MVALVVDREREKRGVLWFSEVKVKKGDEILPLNEPSRLGATF
jgi:hypothetical protein